MQRSALQQFGYYTFMTNVFLRIPIVLDYLRKNTPDGYISQMFSDKIEATYARGMRDISKDFSKL